MSEYSGLRWLLRLLPRSFREDHQRELLRIWREEIRDAAPNQQRAVWVRAFVDTARVAPREFVEAGIRNLRGAARGFRRAPAFAIAAALTLAIGTGATAAVFTLINAVLLRPLPFSAPERVGIVWPISPAGDRTWLSFPELQDLQRERPGIASAAGLADLRLTLVHDGVGHEVQALAVSHSCFDLLGVAPSRGRDFAGVDDRPGAAPVVVLSDHIWRTRFGGNPALIGRTIRLNEDDYEVIGVMPASFSILPASSVMPPTVDVWVALEPHLPSTDRSVRFLHALARLQPGVSFVQAEQRIRAFGARLANQYASIYRGGRWDFTVVPFADDVLKGPRTSLYLVFGLVLMVLLLACANVGNLLLARGEARRAELSVRAALGAGPARLAGELFAEALVIAAAGSALGIALAAAMPPLLSAWDPAALPRLENAGVDANVFAFTLLVCGACTMLVAATPMVERARLQLAAAALAGRSGGRSRRSARAGRVLIVSQTALATAVLITTFFLTAILVELHRVDLGFETDRLITGRIAVSPRSPTAADSAAFFDRVVDAVERVSGVADAAAITQLPLSGAMLGSSFLIETAPDGPRLDADLRGITPDYFRVGGVRLIRGRMFDTRDTANGRAVAIVDEAFARRLHPAGDVIGRRIRWFRSPDVELEIVGVVDSVRHRGPDAPVRETVYRPHRQYARPSMYLVARTTGDPSMVATPIRAAVAAVDAAQPFADVLTMDARMSASVRRVSTGLLLAGILSALALLLSMIGLYGVLSFAVAQRRREFGVRLSLGATPRRVRSMVLREGLGLTAIGVATGAAAAAVTAMTVRSAMFAPEVVETGPYLYGVSAVVVASVTAFGLPARRASSVDPAVAFRADPSS